MDEPATESALIRQAQAGDREAFGALVEPFRRRTYRVALGLTGSPEDALDLSQEAFLRVYQARRKLDPERPFGAWLHQVLRRLCFNFLRNRGTRRARLEEAGGWLEDDAAARAAGAAPDREAERAELRDRIARAIDELPPLEREAIVLREFEGMRYREIAELLAIPEGTVMSRLYAARRRLASALEGER